MSAYNIQDPIMNHETLTKLVLRLMVLMLERWVLRPIVVTRTPNTMNLQEDHLELPPILPRLDDRAVNRKHFKFNEQMEDAKTNSSNLPFSRRQFPDKLDPMVMYLFWNFSVLFPWDQLYAKVSVLREFSLHNVWNPLPNMLISPIHMSPRNWVENECSKFKKKKKFNVTFESKTVWNVLVLRKC